MKAITLHTAALDNAGTRRDGGEQVAVGKAADAISAERAADLVALGMAAPAVTPATAPEKGAAETDAAG